MLRWSTYAFQQRAVSLGGELAERTWENTVTEISDACSQRRRRLLVVVGSLVITGRVVAVIYSRYSRDCNFGRAVVSPEAYVLLLLFLLLFAARRAEKENKKMKTLRVKDVEMGRRCFLFSFFVSLLLFFFSSPSGVWFRFSGGAETALRIRVI